MIIHLFSSYIYFYDFTYDHMLLQTMWKRKTPLRFVSVTLLRFSKRLNWYFSLCKGVNNHISGYFEGYLIFICFQIIFGVTINHFHYSIAVSLLWLQVATVTAFVNYASQFFMSIFKHVIQVIFDLYLPLLKFSMFQPAFFLTWAFSSLLYLRH